MTPAVLVLWPILKATNRTRLFPMRLLFLENMEHRGACGCENNTGDGAGIIIQTPHEFFFDECVKLGVHLPPFGKYGVGVLFFPKGHSFERRMPGYL